MHKTLISALNALVFVAPWALASVAAAAPTSGLAVFVAEGQSYPSQYNLHDKAISVNIDGLVYRGHYTANSPDKGATPGNPAVGSWGRAFLFATSAKVLQCQLDSGFPQVSGRCQGADGRVFNLKPGASGKAQHKHGLQK